MEEQQVSRRKVFSGLFWVYLETICAQAVTFVVTIIRGCKLNCVSKE